MPKISVIVPVYNTSMYLEKCLTSLINQTLTDIEIICINDGSTDNSLEILEKFAKEDSRIKVLSQENAGLSVTRNNGIKAATGEYIGFVDSDDYVDSSFYEKLYTAAKNNNADLSCATIIRKRPDTEKYRVHYTEEKIYTELKDKLETCSIPKCCYVWNKIYRTELIKDYPFKTGVYFEDVLWTPEVLKRANKLVSVPEVNYYYMVNKNSIVKTPTPKKQHDSYVAKKYILEFFKENNIELTKKQKTLTKSIKYFMNIPILKIKEYERRETYYLFGFLPIWTNVDRT